MREIKIKTNKLGVRYFTKNGKTYYREQDLCSMCDSSYKKTGGLVVTGPRVGIILNYKDRRLFRGEGLCVWEKAIYVPEDLVRFYINTRIARGGYWNSRGAKAIAEMFGMEVKVVNGGRKPYHKQKPVKVNTSSDKSVVNININKVKTLVVVANEAK